MEIGLQTLIQLKPVSYKFNPDMNMGSDVHYGFISEEVNSIDPSLATHDANGVPYGLDTNAILAVTVKSIQEMNLKLGDISDVGNMEKSNTWRDSLTAWFGNAGNKITRIFTGEICLTDTDGTTECINKTELKSLKSLLNNSGTASVGSSLGGGATNSSTPQVPVCVLPEVLTNGACAIPANTEVSTGTTATSGATASTTSSTTNNATTTPTTSATETTTPSPSSTTSDATSTTTSSSTSMETGATTSSTDSSTTSSSN